MVNVTVYIPTYNYGCYLTQAIDSVIKQSIHDWELIIIDDGSIDNTQSILQKYKEHPKIRIIEQENKGLNVTNNIAIRLANGRYVMRLDADDYLDENALLVLSNILDKKPDVGLVYSDYYLIDEDGDVTDIVRRKKIGQEDKIFDLPAHGACTMIRKGYLLELGGYLEGFSCQDGYELWLKFIQKYKPYNVNIPLFYYRQHQKNLTKKQAQILENRRNIKRHFVLRYKRHRHQPVIGVIPVLGHSVYRHADPFVKLAGKPLIWYTLNEAAKAEALDRIVVSSEDDAILDYARKYPRMITIKRPKELVKPSTRIQDTTSHILDRVKRLLHFEPHSVCILYITTPLRKAHHIDKAVDTLAIFDVDSVISIQEELSFCYFHRKLGLTPIKKSERNLRIEREAVYKENGAIYLSKAEIIRQGRLLGDKVGHITMLPEESVKINTEFDLWLAESIISNWQKR